MAHNDIFLVGSDIDGTLIFKDGIDDSPAVARFRAAGNIFGCITGRPLCNTLPTFERYNVGYDFVAPMNGAAAITSGGEIIFDERIDGKILMPILKYLRFIGAYECSVDVGLHTRYCMALNHEKNGVPENFNVKPEDLEGLESFSHIAFGFATPELTAEKAQLVNDRFGEYIDAQFHDRNVNCPKRGLDKGTALARVAEFYGIDDDHVYSVGNDLNDMPMLLRHNGYTVADAFYKVREAVPVCGRSAGALLDTLTARQA